MTTELVSPANNLFAPRRGAARIPMSTPQQKLSVPEIPGYYLYWMKGTPERIQKALQGGYEFVDGKETSVTNAALGGDAKTTGSTDLGSRVSVLAGGEELGSDGQPMRLYLMKLKEEYHQEDLVTQQAHSDGVRQALQAGKMGAEKDSGSGDSASRYVGGQTTPNMFQPKPIRRS